MKETYEILKVILILVLLALASGCATNKNIELESNIPGMTKLVHTIEMNAPKSKVWDILADFDNLDWATGVTDSHYTDNKRNGIGMARHCNLADGGYIVERITQWDEGNSFTYVIDDSNNPITTESYAIWSVKENNGQSEVTFEVNYELKYSILGDMMNVMMAKSKFSNDIVKFMSELKAYAEVRH